MKYVMILFAWSCATSACRSLVTGRQRSGNRRTARGGRCRTRQAGNRRRGKGRRRAKPAAKEEAAKKEAEKADAKTDAKAEPKKSDADRKEERRETKRKTAKVEAKRMKVVVTLDGTFTAEKMTPVALRPDAWSQFEIVEIVKHGSEVHEGADAGQIRRREDRRRDRRPRT